LKNLGEDFWGANRLDYLAGAATRHVSRWYGWVERAAYLLVVSVADMVGGERGRRGTPPTLGFQKSRGPCV